MLFSRFAPAAIVVLSVSLLAAAAEPPGGFVRKATWWETVLASREALTRQEADAANQAVSDASLKAFAPWQRDVKAGDAPAAVKVSVAGLKRVYIGASGSAEAWFGEPRLVDSLGQGTGLSVAKAGVLGNRRFRHSGQQTGWTPIVVGDKAFESGFCLQGTELVVELDGKAAWLEMTVGVGGTGTKDRRAVRVTVQARSAIEREGRSGGMRDAIWRAAGEAFAGPGDTRQRRLEELAGIWQADWKPGDFAELARRYAADSNMPKAKSLAQACKSLADLQAVRDLFYVAHVEKRLDLARRTLDLVQRAAPRPELAVELAGMERELAGARDGKIGGAALYARAVDLRRRIVLSHPDLDFDKLLINKRTQALPEHMCDQYLGRHSKVGPGLVVLTDWKTSPKETVLLEGKLPPGGLIHPDLSFDGKRVLFAYADHASARQGNFRGYFLYELSLETGQVRQITGTARDAEVARKDRQTVLVEDMDACYLPDGGIAFISTRSQQYGRCHGGRYVPSYTLFRCDADGSNIRPLSFNEANEWGPSVLHDGSIVYTRWDYINRHDVQYQSLWVMHPDGTETAHYYGNNSPAPCLIGEAAAIPRSNKSVATAAAHHGQTLGTLIIIDPDKGQDHGDPLTWLTPELGFPESGIPRGITYTPLPLPEDKPVGGRSGGRAATPCPVTEDLFFCTYPADGQNGIYLVDTLGGRELIYQDATIACFDPIPLRPRPKPPAMSSHVAGRENEKGGTIYIQDVHLSDQPIGRNSIKSVRVNEIISQPTSSHPVRSAVADEIVKKVLGTVPVNEDGSAALEVPACVPFQLQILDANGMAVMTMRSLMYVQPGERISCVGCHEPRESSPQVMLGNKVTFRKLDPPAGPKYDGGFSYARTVQPVLDRYCIGCHGLSGGARDTAAAAGKPASALVLLGAKTGQFNASYNALVARGNGMLRLAHRNSESVPSRPKDYFAHAGKLSHMLLAGHPDKDGKRRVELDRDSFQRIVDWMDLNGQYYGDYSFNRAEDQPPDPNGEKALRQAVAKRFDPELAAQPYAALVNAALPAESRILLAPLAASAGGWGQIAQGAYTGKDAPAYKEMLHLAEASITRPQFHDIDGTCGRDTGCRCGNCWVRLDRAAKLVQK